jgi:CheY-like chemotaxis protein
VTQPSARILIVDDEPLNVDYLEQELENLGFATDTAANGLEALERVAAAPPDLVLLDVMMPGMDGFSALQVLKGDPETRLIPVVLMTALNSVEDRVRGIEAGADDFLSKPVDERELMARIRTALSHKRAVDETVVALASTSAHLERHGRQQRDVAVLAVDWRLRAADVPEEAVAFVGRRHRDAVERQIRSHGGTPDESDATRFVAVFEGPDERSRAIAAVEAALAVAAERERGLATSLAVTVGPAEVGSTRVDDRWVYGVAGRPVEQAAELARGAHHEGVLVAGAAAAAVDARFALRALGDGMYSVHAPGTAPVPERRIATILVTDDADRRADRRPRLERARRRPRARDAGRGRRVRRRRDRRDRRRPDRLLSHSRAGDRLRTCADRSPRRAGTADPRRRPHRRDRGRRRGRPRDRHQRGHPGRRARDTVGRARERHRA